MEHLWEKVTDLLRAAAIVDWTNAFKIAIELTVIGYAAIWTWRRIKGTQAERLVKGIVVIGAVSFLSWILNLTLITTVLQHLLPVAFVSFVIIFQPEIRRGLGYLGRTTWRVDLSLTDVQKEKAHEVIKHIIKAVRELSKNRVGALIVIEPAEGERDYLSPGTTINGDISSHLLMSIFDPHTPLHDGAVVIRADKIVAAGVILPITDNPKLSLKYGTRHRAAIGLSEIYDGLCIVVSEETGTISAANRGMLVKYKNPDDLADALAYFYNEGTTEPLQVAQTPFQAFLRLFSGNRSNDMDSLAHATLTSGRGDAPGPILNGEVSASFRPDMAALALHTDTGQEPPQEPAVLEDVRHASDADPPALRQ